MYFNVSRTRGLYIVSHYTARSIGRPNSIHWLKVKVLSSNLEPCDINSPRIFSNSFPPNHPALPDHHYCPSPCNYCLEKLFNRSIYHASHRLWNNLSPEFCKISVFLPISALIDHHLPQDHISITHQAFHSKLVLPFQEILQ